MIVGAVGIGLGRLAILLHQVANDVPALAEKTEESRDELHILLVAVGCAIMETDSIVLVNGADDVVEVLCILWSLLQHHLIVVFQFVTKRSHAQGAEQPFGNLSVSITVTTDEIAVAVGLVALNLYAEKVGYLLTVAVESAHTELLAVDVAR